MTTSETTAAQHALWFTEQAGVAAGAYRMALGIWFGPDLDEQAISEAVLAVVERHPLLAAAITAGPDGPVWTDGAEKVSLVVGRLDGQQIDELITRPFDLEHGPLARFELLAGPDRSLLLITAHHLVLDGVSKDILAHDLAAAYNAVLAGRPAALGQRPPTDQEHDQDAVRLARDYWLDRWAAPKDVLLPGLRRVPAIAEEGATVEAELPAELLDRIDPTARELGVTRFELLLTAVHVLLARYGNTGLPVTVALSTRSAADAAEIGLHVNELPLTVSPAAGPVADYARRLRARLRELYPVRTVPMARVVSGLRPSVALAPVSVSYRRQDREPAFDGVATTVDWSMHHAALAQALSLFIVDRPGGLRIVARHSPAAIPAAAVRRIVAQLATVLESIVDDPGREASALPLLPAAERELLAGWNATEQDYPPDAGVPALLAAQVAARPDAVAVHDAGAELTYRQLDAAVGRLAGVLHERGVRSGSLVAVSLPRSLRALTAVLAVLRCGAAYVPVDPGYPAARQALILADAEPALVITTAALAATLPPGTATLTEADTDSGAGKPEQPAADPDSLAYVMYTSGSTGRPKGVEISHRALANLLLGMRDLLDSGPQDRWLALTSLSFDISGLELFLPLITGGRVVIASGLAATDGVAVTDLIRRQQVTHVQATPSAWRILLDAGFDVPVVALAGGEALPLPLARELRARARRLFNVYGPTETTIWSTAAEVPADVAEVTIGRPIANTRFRLVDPAGQPVPIGLAGELLLAGAGVAEGYLRRPELTGQRFGADPDLGRLYRTGDVCRLRPDGQLVYVGRADGQIKIRGHRVELGEIEAHLLEHPEVAQAAVVARGEDVRLAAYVVLRTSIDPADLRAHLAARLPAIMVPSTFTVLPELPHTPNGKLDRAALPEPPTHRTADPAPATTADSDADEIIVELQVIWQDVLKVPDIGLDEDLFDLGGHSLSITRIASRIHQRFGVQVPLDTFFDFPTIGEIAAVVRESKADA